jgi:hypothetical protein
MNKKILFFTDSWFLNFGVAKFFQNKQDYELFAIIDVEEKAKKFFQEQDIVNYKKSWFFMDNIQNNSSEPNYDYLIHFEKKYEINLWSIAFSDREFYNYNRIHKFTINEILNLIEQECKFYEDVLDLVKPDFLSIMLTTSHHQELLRRMCKSQGIKILMLGTTRFLHGMMISEDGGTLDSISDLPEKSNMSLEDHSKYFEKYHASKEMKEYKISNFENNFFARYSSLLKFLFFPFSNSFKKKYWNYGKTKRKVIQEKCLHFIRKKYRYHFIQKFFIKTLDDNTSFIYFPLQMEPERILLIDAKYYTNQISVITNIAKSIPINYTLFVKEHPIMSIWGWRDTNFYKQIMDIPNVKLIHPSVSSDDIIKKCSLVITIAGTAAQEAVFHGKPALSFTKQLYCLLPSVYHIKSFEELPHTIKKLLQIKVDKNSIGKFIDLMNKESFEFPLVKITSDFTYRFGFKGMIMDGELPINEIKKFLKDYENEFEILGLEHVKKINSNS